MSKTSFFLGVAVGIALTVIGLFAMVTVTANSEDDNNIQVKHLEKPVSYEDKSETSFKVFQVFENAALASEISSKEYGLYLGNTAMILGKDYYNDQIITVKNPQRVGTYSYTSKGDTPMTVPVIDGDIE